MFQTLKTALLDILNEVQGTDVNLIIGGGYGLYLRTMYRRQSGERTLFVEWPEARSTSDIDLFLRPELLIDSDKLKPLSEALDKLRYKPVPGAEKYQFKKPGPGNSDAGEIKIDILTGPESSFDSTRVRTDARRARPNPSVGIHAHPTNEALTLEEGLLPVKITGELSSGISLTAEVYLPHPFTFLMMKLFAFRDRHEDLKKEFGRYHALDMYSILATITEKEWALGIIFRDKYLTSPSMNEACHLVSNYFSTSESLGILRLKESEYYRSDFELDKFISALNELFPRGE